jgi:rubrerythrin
MVKKKDTEELLKILKDWKGLEDQTIAFSKDLSKRSKNALVKMTMEMIRRDSEKHKIMLQAAIDNETKEAMHISPDELLAIGNVLDKHLDAETKSLSAASDALSKSKDFFTRYIISYLMADETKHHEMLSRLDAIKRRYVPY